MAVLLDHTIIAMRDQQEGAQFLTEMLGLPPHQMLGHFAVVKVGETSLDIVEADGDIASRHFAFRVSETEFDQVFERIKSRGIAYYADPFCRRQGEINRWDDGRGLYFHDPSGHLLEVLTRSYGSGGHSATRPNPLLGQPAG